MRNCITIKWPKFFYFFAFHTHKCRSYILSFFQSHSCNKVEFEIKLQFFLGVSCSLCTQSFALPPAFYFACSKLQQLFSLFFFFSCFLLARSDDLWVSTKSGNIPTTSSPSSAWFSLSPTLLSPPQNTRRKNSAAHLRFIKISITLIWKKEEFWTIFPIVSIVDWMSLLTIFFATMSPQKCRTSSYGTVTLYNKVIHWIRNMEYLHTVSEDNTAP